MPPVVVITASSTGIGLAIAKALLPLHHVVISSRSSSNVESALSTLHPAPHGVSGLVCHVANETQRQKLLEHAKNRGEIKALILNAAASTTFGPILKTTEAQWDKMFEVNVKSNFLMTKLFVPYMTHGSSIVIMSSIGAYTAFPGLGVYSISKTALLGMVNVLGSELAKKGIRVNGVAPGLIKTKFSEALWKGNNSYVDRGLFRIPMKRLGEADDVAEVVKFLVSGAAYVTGETIVVAGGARSKL